MSAERPRRIIVGITGASGVIHGVELLRALARSGVETHLIVSDSGKRTLGIETDLSMQEVQGLASVTHDWRDVGGAVASGSFLTEGMAVVPCSIKTLSAIVHSFNENLLVRAADVCLKEKRKLVLAVRETPLHLGHLRLLCSAAELGAVILPPSPGFYHGPATIADLVHQIVGKILDQFQIPHELFARWGEGAGPAAASSEEKGRTSF
jgi:4-hydroxy-3-polyprenylbenzoate decarboxylase